MLTTCTAAGGNRVTVARNRLSNTKQTEDQQSRSKAALDVSERETFRWKMAV